LCTRFFSCRFDSVREIIELSSHNLHSFAGSLRQFVHKRWRIPVFIPLPPDLSDLLAPLRVSLSSRIIDLSLGARQLVFHGLVSLLDCVSDASHCFGNVLAERAVAHLTHEILPRHIVAALDLFDHLLKILHKRHGRIEGLGNCVLDRFGPIHDCLDDG